MEVTELKTDLHYKIEHADDEQLMELHGLITNYLNGHSEIEEWDLLPEYHKERITESLKQADEGLGKPLDDVLKSLKEKYGLNG